MQKPIYVDSGAALQALASSLDTCDWIAVDTEFERSRTYYPQLCLLQVADAGRIACIDPLAIDDLSPIAEVLANTRVRKVFHAASQDLEVLYQTLGVMPAPVFDTQLAAALLGHPDQIGYARLVKALLNVELEKAHTRADWTKRPLSEAELAYAADDVRYLRGVYEALVDELARRNRSDWLDADFQSLTDPQRYSVEPEQAFRRVRGWSRLRPSQQQVLARLAAWRENEAMTRDRPRRWVMKDDVLQDVARRRPTNAQALEQIRGITDKTVQRHGEALLEAVRAGRAAPAEPLAQAQRRLAPEQEPLVDILMAALRQCAAEADLAPAALANRKDLERLVAGERDLALLAGWRRRAAGECLLGLLSGETSLQVKDGRLAFQAP